MSRSSSSRSVSTTGAASTGAATVAGCAARSPCHAGRSSSPVAVQRRCSTCPTRRGTSQRAAPRASSGTTSTKGFSGRSSAPRHAVELAPRRRGDPGEHAARVAQPRLARHPDQQRPDRVRPPARGDPAADHDVLDATHGRLDPAPRAPADLVGGLEALGDDAVEAVAPRRGDHRLGAHAVEVRGDDDAAAGEVELGEQLAALAVGQPARRGAGHLEHVEHVEGDRHARLQDLRGVGDAGPAAQLAGAGAARPRRGRRRPRRARALRCPSRAPRPRAPGSAT